ncbi:nucleotide pyrophosphohydrolase [Candidatus Thorarchaeota archaeon]|nr:MAG: nucleotide pyrophosphohydrolase [Candidatus Thorarchaeota archaeon]
MEIREAQEMMRQIYLKRDRERGIERTILRTYEELAELSEAIQGKESRRELEGEFGDVLAWLCSLANLLDIDLDTALLSKYDHVCSRCRKAPCECSDTP